MSDLDLAPLVGTNPLGFFAALGALDVLHRSESAADPTLRWTEGMVPHAVLGGVDDLDSLVEAVDIDRRAWAQSVLLQWGPAGAPADDVKIDRAGLGRWATDVAATLPEGRAAADLFCALVAEGAVAGKGDSKPTHLHFTAGQQRFLGMVRHLANAVTPADLEEALGGPWVYASSLPSLGWDAIGERIFAIRATDPAKEQRSGVPGADWLAFLGLTFFPVATRGTGLRTTACSATWKRGWFRWPLWDIALRPRTIRSLVSDPTVSKATDSERRARGITTLLQAPIRRSDQGGYGSFGPANLAPPPDQPAGPRSARRPRSGRANPPRKR